MIFSDSGRSLNVFVTVGTHEQGFPRILTAVAQLVAELSDVSWRVQTGPASPDLPSFVEARAAYSHGEMMVNLEWADATISQASPGNVFGAIKAVSQPIVMARRAALGEHVDDHQVHFASHLERSGLAMVADDASMLALHLAGLRSESVAARRMRLSRLHEASLARTHRWVEGFDRVVQELSSHRRAHENARTGAY